MLQTHPLSKVRSQYWSIDESQTAYYLGSCLAQDAFHASYARDGLDIDSLRLTSELTEPSCLTTSVSLSNILEPPLSVGAEGGLENNCFFCVQLQCARIFAKVRFVVLFSRDTESLRLLGTNQQES